MCACVCVGGWWTCYMLLGKNHHVAIKQRRLQKYFDSPRFAKHPFKIVFLLRFVFKHTHPSQLTYNPRVTRVFVRDSVYYSQWSSNTFCQLKVWHNLSPAWFKEAQPSLNTIRDQRPGLCRSCFLANRPRARGGTSPNMETDPTKLTVHRRKFQDTPCTKAERISLPVICSRIHVGVPSSLSRDAIAHREKQFC